MRTSSLKPQASSRNRRAMLLVAVLVIITVLALLGASFSYLMNAQLAAVKANQDQQQAYFAAMTGIDRVIEMLREGRVLQDNWYNNPELFRRIPVFIPGQREDDVKGGSTSLADQEVIPGRWLWRFSIVATEIPKDDSQRATMRYGITDEAGKVNLNVATRSQLIALFDTIRHDNVTSTALADALIDWRDADDDPSPEGAESSYYLTLKPAYRCKNAPLVSVEELLQIKGFNGRIVYGEDYNRNGYMDKNENDGEEGTFPPDDGDGKLDRGLLPFVTVYSWDWNRANDNVQRTDINTIRFAQAASGANGLAGDDTTSKPGTTGKQGIAGKQSANGQQGANALQGGGDGQDDPLAALAKAFTRVPPQVTDEIRPEVIDFIAAAQARGYKFKSVGDLLGLEITGSKSNHDQMWREYAKNFRQAEARLDDETAQAQDEEMVNGDQEDQAADLARSGLSGNTDNTSRSGSGSQNTTGQGKTGQTRTGQGTGSQNKTGQGTGSNPGNNNTGGNDNSTTPRRDNNFNGTAGKDNGRKMRSIGTPGKGAAPQTPFGSGPNSGTSGQGPGRQPPRPGPGPNTGGSPGSQNPGAMAPNAPGNPSSGTPGSNPNNNPNPNGPGGPGGQGGPGGPIGQPGQGPGANPPNGTLPGQGNNPGGPNAPGGGLGQLGNLGGNPGGNTGGTLVSPVEASDLPALCDRLTVWSSPVISGLINVNTAPVQVLRTIPGLTDQDAESIVEKRAGLQGLDKLTPAWLVTSGAISPETFALISNLVTTRSIQFTIDAIGFNDQVGTVKRIQAVVEMRGELATIKYFRDITSLGIGYPVWDDQRSEGFAFAAR